MAATLPSATFWRVWAKQLWAPVTTELNRLSHRRVNETTLRHRGQNFLDTKGNVRVGDGNRWPGGSPFPDGGTAQQIVAANTLAWGRHDGVLYPIKKWEVGPKGEEQYHY